MTPTPTTATPYPTKSRSLNNLVRLRENVGFGLFWWSVWGHVTRTPRAAKLSVLVNP